MRPSRFAAAAAVVLVAGLVPAVGFSTAGAAPDRPLNRPIEGFKASDDKVRVTPRSYSAVRVDVAQVRSDLRVAPVEGQGAGLTFEVPSPAGGTERFAVTETTVMEPELAAAHPEVATYSGLSLDNSATSIALDVR